MTATTSRRHLLTTGLGLAGLAALPALAQDKFPSRPITLVVPFPPGGSVDIMARQYSEPLSRVLGVPTLCATGPLGGHPHTEREYCELSTFVPRAQAVALAVLAHP